MGHMASMHGGRVVLLTARHSIVLAVRGTKLENKSQKRILDMEKTQEATSSTTQLQRKLCGKYMLNLMKNDSRIRLMKKESRLWWKSKTKILPPKPRITLKSIFRLENRAVHP